MRSISSNNLTFIFDASVDGVCVDTINTELINAGLSYAILPFLVEAAACAISLFHCSRVFNAATTLL